MDNRLVLAVLFVTLSWMSMGINAQNAENMTLGNMTSGPNMTTAMENNATRSPNATIAPQMTTVMGNNATTAANVTTAVGNNATTAANVTTAVGNNATTAANVTTAVALNTTGTTTAAPLVANTTVETLTTEITNAQCGTQQLCAAEPAKCDPSNNGSCFFLAAKQLSGQNFQFGLAGDSDGYVAASLSTNSAGGGNVTTYICANNNGSVKFFGALLNNGRLTVTQLNVNSLKGKVKGRRIECTFAATVPDSSTRASAFSLSILTGPFNSTSDDLGTPTTLLKTAPVDLANPNATATVTNLVSANTTTSPTTVGNNATTAANVTTAVALNTTGTTTAAPLVANTTVETLTTEITNAQCGTQQLCAAEPAKCDPSNNGSCFFLAAKQLSGQNFQFGLAGDSDGYVAASLSTNSAGGGNDTTYICANNKGSVKFFGALLNNGRLTVTQLNVNSVKGKVKGRRIECTFAATVPDSSTRASAFSLSILTGSFNSTSDDLGTPTTLLKTAPVDLTNPNATVTNLVSANTTTSPTTMATSHAITLQQSLTHALLIVAAVLGLVML